MTGLRRWVEEQPLPRRLHWTAEYFRWCGMSSLAFAGMNLVFLTVMPTLRAELAAHPVQLAIGLAVRAVLSVAWWLTGEWLLARRRDGAWLAIATLALPVLEIARGAGGRHVFSLVIPILGIAAILTSWRELE